MTTTGPVVVAHDGHPHAERLVDAAAEEAARLGVPLLVVALVHDVDNPDLTVQARRREMQYAVERMEHTLRDSAARERDRRPDVSIATRTLDQPSAADVQATLAGCRLLVLGSHGPGERPAFAMDTTSQQLLRAAACPVLVVPVHTPLRETSGVRHIVVGIAEPDEEAARIIEAAQTYASPSGHVTVLHAYRQVNGETAESAHARAAALCADLVATVTVADPTVTVERTLTDQPATSALIDQAVGARMLVIGSRGPMALAGMTLDSVSHAVLAALPCPVLVVPRSVTSDPDRTV